jgi:hypothetical protein
LPRLASRDWRGVVEPGSMPYSALIHIAPLPRRHCGTLSSSMAVHKTRVPPDSARHEPSEVLRNPGVNLKGRGCSACRLSILDINHFLIFDF